MRTTLELDEQLVALVMQLSGSRTKKRAIHTALEAYVKFKRRQELSDMIGSDEHGMDLAELERVRDAC